MSQENAIFSPNSPLLRGIAEESSLFHVIFGGGEPEAVHCRVAFPPSPTNTSLVVSWSIMSGGTAKH